MDDLADLPNVTFAGFVGPDRVGEVYEQARIFLNTSDWEGFPNGFLYAWTRGIPACSLHIDPDGVVSGGDLGLVDPDPARLAAAMDGLLDDPERYAAMARRCHDHVRERHDLDRAVDAFAAVLTG
jgi:glycosyltransferase involved in cell wall biosynthesis